MTEPSGVLNISGGAERPDTTHRATAPGRPPGWPPAPSAAVLLASRGRRSDPGQPVTPGCAPRPSTRSGTYTSDQRRSRPQPVEPKRVIYSGPSASGSCRVAVKSDRARNGDAAWLLRGGGKTPGATRTAPSSIGGLFVLVIPGVRRPKHASGDSWAAPDN
jgi:hypothetical protein